MGYAKQTFFDFLWAQIKLEIAHLVSNKTANRELVNMWFDHSKHFSCRYLSTLGFFKFSFKYCILHVLLFWNYLLKIVSNMRKFVKFERNATKTGKSIVTCITCINSTSCDFHNSNLLSEHLGTHCTLCYDLSLYKVNQDFNGGQWKRNNSMLKLHFSL